MSNVRQIILIGVAILNTLTVTACGAISPAATPTPFLTATPTPSATATPTPEFEQRPELPPPAMEGDIDVGGKHILSYQCFGDGNPTVIVEAAADDRPTRSMSWNAVIQGIYPATRICIYDRVPVNTSQDGAENLHILLSKIPLAGPYILVAHSIGGWYARVFTHLYPQEVAGMLLVDTTPTYPDSTILLATAYPTYSADEAAGIAQNRLPAADINTIIMPQVDGLDMKVSNEQVRQAGSFGNIPLIVICHTPGPSEMMPGLDPVVQQQIAALILKVLADQAALSSKGVFITAETHHHFISLYQPQIIIDAITRMVNEIRK